MSILIPIIILGALGVIFGIGLGIASKKLIVKIDPKLEKIINLLPGSNCGACGQAGCLGFAEQLLSGKSKIDSCKSSGDEIKKKIAQILGQELVIDIKKTAVLHCKAGITVKNNFVYLGRRDCRSANLVLGGQKACAFGCLGLGTCVASCPFNAIKMSEQGFPIVDRSRCRACNKCVMACPKKLFSLDPESTPVYIGCSSRDTGPDTRANCPCGCIACGICQKTCRFYAIKIIDNLAVIDYNKCTSCGECVKACPMKCILSRL